MVPVAVVGAAGYSGVELIEILLRHPAVLVVGLFGSSRAEGSAAGGTPIGDLAPRLRGRVDLPVRVATADAIAGTGARAVFLCTPHEASLELAGSLLGGGPAAAVWETRAGADRCVLDLSAAFRLKRAEWYPEYYGFVHHRPELLAEAVYGLPEVNRLALAGGRAARGGAVGGGAAGAKQHPGPGLVAVPGCYPTSVILPIWPLVRAGAVMAGRAVIVDSTSGVSGAGRTPTARTHLCEVSQSPYNVWAHRHRPEMEQGLAAGADGREEGRGESYLGDVEGSAAKGGPRVVFTPHLGPYDRGILSTMHVPLSAGWSGARCREVLERAYGAERFVRLLPAGVWPAVGAVRGTNFCDIQLAADDSLGHLIVCSAIDNMVKGAAGQAVQCLNVRFGMPEAWGLEGSAAVGVAGGGA